MSNDLINELAEKISAINFSELEIKLGISPGFFHKFYESESDWSIVIKFSVIIEAIVDQLINSYFEKLPKKFISKLNLNGQTGKIQLLSDLNLMSSAERNKILEILKIRNKFAHSIEYIDKDLLDYYLSLSEEESHNFFNKLITGTHSSKKRDHSNESSYDKNVLKMIFFTGCTIVLISITNKWLEILAEKMSAEAPILINEFNTANNTAKKEELRNKLIRLLEKLEKHPKSLINIKN